MRPLPTVVVKPGPRRARSASAGRDPCRMSAGSMEPDLGPSSTRRRLEQTLNLDATDRRPSLRTIATILAILMSYGLSAFAQEFTAPKQIAFDYSAVYKELNPSIVKIHADAGSGSGFLVSADGLIATNHHVAKNSRFLAVQFADGRKFAAQAVTLDPRYDVAILKVNREIVAELKPLMLLPESRDGEVVAGIPVLAFGSPLSQTFLMTTGIVAKVESDVLLGDFLIQPGNSGGPLVNLKGEVVGINTFAERAISGAVRISALRRVLESDDVVKFSQPDPPAAPLPALSADRYPTELLKQKILNDQLDQSAHQLDAGKFRITAITPVLIGKMQVQADMQQAQNRFRRRGKKISDPAWREVDAPFYEWMRSSQYLDNAVTFEIKPDFGTTTGSKWAAALAGISAGLARTAVQPVHQTYEFKAEFQDFKLYRDNELIQPIHPGRAITEQSLEAPYVDFVDEAYSGMYVYGPEVFLAGKVYRLEVYDAREPGRAHKTITLPAEHKFIQQLRKDFSDSRKAGT